MSSYDGKFGHVNYYVKAVMERFSQPTVECKRYFEVEEPVDVNTPDLVVSHQMKSTIRTIQGSHTACNWN